jgi:hypothetical protein
MNRAVSFWIDWRFLDWPGENVRDIIVRRCDEMAAADVNLAIIFGTHFRWDYLPILSRVHDLLAFTSEQLHQRKIRLFDHHSSVLTHRIRKPEDREHIRKHNYHHLSFYPDTDFAAQMKYNGSYLNDWRMLDVATGLPIYIEAYRCEQFCMNNPAFREAYQVYLRRLIRDVPLDGLMSDDGIYYAGWDACGCGYCREKFAAEYGHRLPPVSDSSFWFNRDNRAFMDWIDFRYLSTGEFMGIVRDAVGGLPLMTCCSNSSGQACNAYATSDEEFAPHTSMSMLEICGPGIDGNGKWTDWFLGRAMLQIAITRTYGHDSCLGLGYGFVKNSAEIFWQVNRLLGMHTWFSTLKGRLIPKGPWLDSFPEEQNLVGNLFTWEKSHEELFEGASDAKVGVYFARGTRDHYARSYYDFEAVYKAACQDLLDENITFDVVCRIDEISRYSVVVLPAAACLSQRERDRLRKYLKDGGVIIAVGPIGLRDDDTGAPDEFLREFGVDIEVKFPSLPAGYQPTEDVYHLPSICCSGVYNGAKVPENTWARINPPEGGLYWTPSLDPSKKDAERISDIIKGFSTEPVEVIAGLNRWHVRRYRKDKSIILVGMNSNITPKFSEEYALAFGPQPIVEKLEYDNPCRHLTLKTKDKISSAKMFTVEHQSPFVAAISSDGTEISFLCDETEKFFVVELIPEK